MNERPTPLLERLEAGDELHKEAARRIRELQIEVREMLQEGQREAQQAFSEGRWAEREAREDRW